ncbi:hypothetical protein R1sor_007388 [Riccia sorocarpa]|uniref:Uncharacterized protein n=1 Tax=Riccia sorocarpa TaxID=122646 RepID=A0ABD3HQB7_9MARC
METWKRVQEKYRDSSATEKFLKGWVALRKHIKSLQYEKAKKLHELPEKEKQLKELMEMDPNTLSKNDQIRLGELITEKFKRRKARTTITKLVSEDGQLLTSREEIKKEIFNHYSALYAAQDGRQNRRELSQQLLANVNSRISPEEGRMLDEPPSDNEIFDTLHLLPSGKSPGPDGFTKEVFLILWPIVGSTFCDAVLEFWESQSLAPYFKDGLLFLLPKVDDPREGIRSIIASILERYDAGVGLLFKFYCQSYGSAGGRGDTYIIRE